MGIETAILVAAGAGAATGVAGAVESRKSRKDAEAANAKAEEAAAAAQAEQEALAAEEEAAANEKLEEQRARILKAQQGRSGLLFGNELGVDSESTTKAKTLGE